jgi:hypothetical protein
MAVRVPKRIQDLSGVPTPSGTLPTVLYRGSDGSFAWKTISQLLGDIASATGALTGQDYYIDISGSASGAVAQPTGLQVSGEIGTVTASGVRNETALPSGLEVTGAIGTVEASVEGAVTATPSGLEVTGEIGTVTASGVRNETGTPSGLETTGEIGTVTAEGTSGAVAISDDFNRANGGLGANWTTLSGFGAPQISTNVVVGSTEEAAYYSAATPAANQYVQAFCDTSEGFTAIRVRQASGANTCYELQTNYVSDPEDWTWKLYKFVAGTPTLIASGALAETYLRLEASGAGNDTTLVVKSGPNGSSWTTRHTASGRNDGIASGSLAFRVMTNSTLDDFSGGDLP